MKVAVIGTGFIGGVLGRGIAGGGHEVTFGSRHPGDDEVAAGTPARVASVADALNSADVVILALPGAAVADLAASHGDLLAGKLVIDATNQMGQAVPNSRAHLPATLRYARAFNTLGGENMADPVFPDGRADMFFSAGKADVPVLETLIGALGLRPVYVGEDEALIDSLFRLWIALAMGQGRGRRIALRLMEG